MSGCFSGSDNHDVLILLETVCLQLFILRFRFICLAASSGEDFPTVLCEPRAQLPAWKAEVRGKMFALKSCLDNSHPESLTLQVLGSGMGFLESLPTNLLHVQLKLQVDSPLTPLGMLPIALMKWGCSAALPDDMAVQEEVLSHANISRVARKSFTAFEAKLLMLYANGTSS